MLTERRIEREWVERTIRAPDIVEPDPNRPGVTRAFRRIPERDNRVLRVAYITAGDTFQIITLFFDRARRRSLRRR